METKQDVIEIQNDSHTLLVKALIKQKLLFSDDGNCFGWGSAAIICFLADDIGIFLETKKYLISEGMAQDNFDITRKPKKYSILDVLNIISKIQNLTEYKELNKILQESHKSSSRISHAINIGNDSNKTLKINPPQGVTRYFAAYNQKNILTVLNTLTTLFKTHTPHIHTAISMSSNNHIVTLLYRSDKDLWAFVEYNQDLTQKLVLATIEKKSTIKNMAKNIIQAFEKVQDEPTDEDIPLLLTIHVNPEDVNIMKTVLKKLDTDETWKEIHNNTLLLDKNAAKLWYRIAVRGGFDILAELYATFKVRNNLEALNTIFNIVITYGSISDVQTFIDKGASITEPQDYPPICTAIKKNNLNMVKFLIEHKAVQSDNEWIKTINFCIIRENKIQEFLQPETGHPVLEYLLNQISLTEAKLLKFKETATSENAIFALELITSLENNQKKSKICPLEPSPHSPQKEIDQPGKVTKSNPQKNKNELKKLSMWRPIKISSNSNSDSQKMQLRPRKFS